MTDIYLYSRSSSQRQKQRGYSAQRQDKRCHEWIANNPDCTLVETINEHGTSGFTGEAVTDGKLGEFITRCESGLIPRGSILLVEDVTRFSRLAPKRAQRLFDRILATGIDIVLAADDMRYTDSDGESDEDFSASILLSLKMRQAFTESETRSAKVRATFKQQRDKMANGFKRTSTSVPWLKLNSDRTNFETIEPHTSTVKYIYQLRLKGTGTRVIAETLTKESIPTFKAGGVWRSQYVAKLLKNPAVTGTLVSKETLTPSERRILEREGKPVPKYSDRVTEYQGYYPSIIDSDTFTQVQSTFLTKRTGRGTNFPNIFRGFIHCHCGGSISTKTGNGHTYYQCQTRQSGGKSACSAKPHPLPKLQSRILAVLPFLPYGDMNGKPANTDVELAQLELTISDLEKQYSTLKSNLKLVDDRDLVTELLTELSNIKSKLSVSTQERDKLKSNAITQVNTKDVQSTLQQAKIDTPEQRELLNVFLRKYIGKIEVHEDHFLVFFQGFNDSGYKVWMDGDSNIGDYFEDYNIELQFDGDYE